MKYRLTILNLSFWIFLLGCIVYTTMNYDQLSEGEGWGIVFMIGIIIFGASSLLVDFFIQWLVKNHRKQKIISALALIIYVILFWIGIR